MAIPLNTLGLNSNRKYKTIKILRHILIFWIAGKEETLNIPGIARI